jgi:hypothetical protein
MERSAARAHLGSSCVLVLLSIGLAGPVVADPLPGENTLKFQQVPLTGARAAFPYPGHDETSTAYATVDPMSGQPTGWQGTFMADDFADTSSSPVLHVAWWGSYAGNDTGPSGGVKRFLISFESDVPAGGAGGGFSHPGAPLSSQIVTKGPLAPRSGTFTEKPVPGAGGTETLYQYNAELGLGHSFLEQPNTVYWLKIVALVDTAQDGSISWGWHDRDWSVPDGLASVPPAVAPGEGVVGSLLSGQDVHHFQDDAVSGSIVVTPALALQQSGFSPQRYLDSIDGPMGIEQFSKDLAFELYTVPEPATAGLLALGVAALRLVSRRARGIDPDTSR